MSLPKTILDIIKVIHDKLEIIPENDEVMSISLWDFRDENEDLIPKNDLKSGLRKLAEDKKLFQLKDILCLDKRGRFNNERLELRINREKFRKFYQDNKYIDLKKPLTNGIYYNPKTGIGYAYGKRFKFKNDQPEFTIFAEMIERINNPVPRKRVLELANYPKSENDRIELLTNNVKRKASLFTSATYFINELAKKMRNMTRLNTDQITNNNGELTLVGKRLNSPPK